MPNPSKLKSPLQALRDAFSSQPVEPSNLPAVTQPATGLTRRELLGRAVSTAARSALPDLSAMGSVLSEAGSFAEGAAPQMLAKSVLTSSDLASAYPAMFSLAVRLINKERHIFGEEAFAEAEKGLQRLRGPHSGVSEDDLAQHEEVLSKLPKRLLNRVPSYIGDFDQPKGRMANFKRDFEAASGKRPEDTIWSYPWQTSDILASFLE